MNHVTVEVVKNTKNVVVNKYTLQIGAAYQYKLPLLYYIGT